MNQGVAAARQRLAGLSSSARRLLDYVAVMEGGVRYAVVRHIVRVTEEDLVEDLKEVVDAGILTALPGEPNLYDFADESVRSAVLAEIGDARAPKLRQRAEAARRRVEGQRG